MVTKTVSFLDQHIILEAQLLAFASICFFKVAILSVCHYSNFKLTYFSYVKGTNIAVATVVFVVHEIRVFDKLVVWQPVLPLLSILNNLPAKDNINNTERSLPWTHPKWKRKQAPSCEG